MPVAARSAAIDVLRDREQLVDRSDVITVAQVPTVLQRS